MDEKIVCTAADIARWKNEARLDELEQIADEAVAASYQQDGRDWQGLAVPRNIIRKRLGQLQSSLAKGKV